MTLAGLPEAIILNYLRSSEQGKYVSETSIFSLLLSDNWILQNPSELNATLRVKLIPEDRDPIVSRAIGSRRADSEVSALLLE